MEYSSGRCTGRLGGFGRTGGHAWWQTGPARARSWVWCTWSLATLSTAGAACLCCWATIRLPLPSVLAPQVVAGPVKALWTRLSFGCDDGMATSDGLASPDLLKELMQTYNECFSSCSTGAFQLELAPVLNASLGCTLPSCDGEALSDEASERVDQLDHPDAGVAVRSFLVPQRYSNATGAGMAWRGQQRDW